VRECTREFLSLFFNEGEKICVSNNEFGYHSVSQDTLDGTIRLLSPPSKETGETRSSEIEETDICLMALNPIEGYRKDKNVTAYRSFLVEMDDGTLPEQMKYIEDSGLPYSVCIFSGNKSLHFGIVLENDIIEEYLWRNIAEWILNILDQADPMTKNPSRSIRFPNNMRKDGKCLEQKLVKMKGRVNNDILSVWLNKYPDLNPATIKAKRPRRVSTSGSIGKVPLFVVDKVRNYDPYGDNGMGGRNGFWYWVGRRLSESGFDFDEMLHALDPFFIEDNTYGSSFLTEEYESTIKRAHDDYWTEEGI